MTVLGQLVCYGCGTAWYMVYAGGGAWILLQTVVPYLIPDAVKIALAWRLTKKLKKKI